LKRSREPEEGKGKGKEDIPGITTFLTSLLTMRTSDSNLCSLLPRWGDVISFSFLAVIAMVKVSMSVVVVVVLMVWW
jgi:hypothetical protein